MKINDLSYLEDISEALSIEGGKQRTTVNISQNARATVSNIDGISLGNTAIAMNLAIVNITNYLVQRLGNLW